jgi:uncharacterized protein (TIGR01244 family)
MKLSQLDNQVSVSDQITAAEVAELAREGVEILVCNRPDGEVADQPPFDAIAHACQNLDMEIQHIPFSGDAIEEHHVQSFLELLQSGRKVHAYCRSGARSSKLWARARARQGMDPEEIKYRAGQAGVDVSHHVQP